MSFLTKRPKPTEQDISSLRLEIENWNRLEEDAKTDIIKRFILTLENTREDTIKQLKEKDIDSFDSEVKLIFFLASIRAKLQVVDAIKSQYLNAGDEKQKLLDELNKILEGR